VRQFKYVDAFKKAWTHDRWQIYNERKAICVDWKSPLSAEEQQRADAHWHVLVPWLGRYKQGDKRRAWHSIHRALERAALDNGVVCIPRNKNHPEYQSIRLQVADAADTARIAFLVRSPKGAPKMSRLMPNPRRIKPVARTCFVEMRDRETNEQLEADPQHPVFQRTMRVLTLVNEVNANWEITIEPYNYRAKEDEDRIRIQPVLYRVFTDDFRTHGRIYGEHQSHGKRARRSIRFDGQPSIELDYAALHPRMLYHLEGIDYQRDPYQEVRGERLLVKQLINTAINAVSKDAAISACNNAMNPKTEQGQWKTGKAREDAAQLREAYTLREGTTFKTIYAEAVERHPAIARHFGTDAGIKLLMPLDSKIALRVLYQFAKAGVPCLPLHDSFIVPASQAEELKRVMVSCYVRELGFAPVVK
jgi:hypothetical protein